jgi:pimeloyl-ACP methyl ester carboxylesterase
MQNDDKANIEAILEYTGEDKIYYIGYSQGSTQMHYALAQDNDWFKERLHRAVMLAPCFYRVHP